MFHFAARNLILFFKDKAAVFLSFLAEFIIVVLYILFIRDNLIEKFAQINDADLLTDIWMIAGLLGITSVTTTMGACGIMVDDKAGGIDRDFASSPVSRKSVVGGYMTAAVIIGLILSWILFMICRIYILWKYQVDLVCNNLITVYVTLILSTISNCCIVLLVVSFLKSSNALASCCTILGALIGFLTGIYLPMGSMPQSAQLYVKAFPVSHGVVLFRKELMQPFIDDSFKGRKLEEIQWFSEYMGVNFTFEGGYMTWQQSVLVLAAVAAVCFILTIFKLRRR